MRVFCGRRLRALWIASIVMVAPSLGVAVAQYGGSPALDPNSQIRQASPTRQGDDEPYVAREMQIRQIKRLREEHQRQVLSDTAKLVELATTLKSEVDKGNKPTPDAIKDVDEIGKLARRVSERIKTQ